MRIEDTINQRLRIDDRLYEDASPLERNSMKSIRDSLNARQNVPEISLSMGGWMKIYAMEDKEADWMVVDFIPILNVNYLRVELVSSNGVQAKVEINPEQGRITEIKTSRRQTSVEKVVTIGP